MTPDSRRRRNNERGHFEVGSVLYVVLIILIILVVLMLLGAI